MVFAKLCPFWPGHHGLTLTLYNQVPLQHGPIHHHTTHSTAITVITHSTAITVTESASDFRITIDTPYLTLTGKLWGVFCGNFGENWLLCNDTALYSLQTGASITASDSLHSHLVIPNTILIALKYLMFVAHYWIPNHSRTHLPNAFYIQWMALSSKKTDVSLLFFVTVLKSFHSPLIIIWALFQYKDCLSKYGDFHDKDKISSLSWWPYTGRKASLYWDAPWIHLLHTW